MLGLASDLGWILHSHPLFPQIEVVASTEVGVGSSGPTVYPAQVGGELSQEEQLIWAEVFCSGSGPAQGEPTKKRK